MRPLTTATDIGETSLTIDVIDAGTSIVDETLSAVAIATSESTSQVVDTVHPLVPFLTSLPLDIVTQIPTRPIILTLTPCQ